MKRRFFAIPFVIAALVSTVCSAQITVGNVSDVRLVTEPSGSRDNDNGGNTESGRLIGINTGLIDNFMVFGFGDLAAVSGETISAATVTFTVAQGFMNANHGSIDDIIVLNELALPNIGWVEGNGAISGTTNSTTDGSISYNNREQFFSNSTPWQDASGADVANLEGAITQLATAPGYNEGAAPPSFSFDVDGATAQSWADNGLAGLVLSNIDDGDDRSRFNLGVNFNNFVVEIDFTTGMTGGGDGGDFDGNGIFDCADVDSLVTEIVDMTNNAAFDLNGDMIVDNVDLDLWLLEAGEEMLGLGRALLRGDANLDGSVDVSDFNIWNGNQFTNTAAFCSGDFNADGVVDVGDFNVWNGNNFQSADVAPVPEPAGTLLVLTGFAALAMFRRRR